MSDSECYQKADFSESRIFRSFFRSFRIVNSTHDMIIVKWDLLNFSKAKFVLSEYLPNVPKCGLCGLNTIWTHDMIIVKWHLFIWHERKLCALTSAPPVQSTQMGQWLSTLFHANCSAAQVYVLHPGQFIFALSCRRRSFLQVLQSTERQERYLEKLFVCLMMTNVMMKTCFNRKIIKISNLIQAMKNSVCPKAKVMRRPNFSESRICPNIYRMFRSVDWTHDMIIVKWHLFIWHERKRWALTNSPPVQSTYMGHWLSTLFHANCSAAQVYVLYRRQIMFAPSCRRRPFLEV